MKIEITSEQVQKLLIYFGDIAELYFGFTAGLIFILLVVQNFELEFGGAVSLLVLLLLILIKHFLVFNERWEEGEYDY